MSGKETARLLRQHSCLSLPDIAEKLGVSRSTVKRWTRDIKLTSEQRTTILRNANGRKSGLSRSEVNPSFLFRLAAGREFSTDQKGAIGEAAVSLRLLVLNYQPTQSVFDGSKLDMVVDTIEGLKKIQVRWASYSAKYGAPTIKLTVSDGRKGQRRFRDDEFDVLVGYDLLSNNCFVFNHEDLVGNAKSRSMEEAAREAWAKLPPPRE